MRPQLIAALGAVTLFTGVGAAAGLASAAGGESAASCTADSYDGSALTLHCSVPQATVTKTVPAGTATVTVTASPSSSPTTVPSSTPTTTQPTTTQPTSPSPTSTTPAAAKPFVQPGTVGYVGAVADLKVYQPGGAAPAGCSWQAYGLRCDATTLTLDHAYVKGGIYFTGSGAVNVTRSIIQGGSGSEWYAFYDANPSSTARLTFADSTLGWLPGKTYPSGFDVAPIWTRSATPLDVQRCDLSGMPQGLDPTGNSVVKDTWIHGLVQNSTDPAKPTHLDGVFSQGGNNILISGNYIDVPLRNPSDITAAVFFQNIPCTPMTAITVTGNYLHGGSFTLRNECAQGLKVTGNTFAGGTYGHAYNSGSMAEWSGNVTLAGAPVAKP